jgi:hypothetical protein
LSEDSYSVLTYNKLKKKKKEEEERVLTVSRAVEAED